MMTLALRVSFPEFSGHLDLKTRKWSRQFGDFQSRQIAEKAFKVPKTLYTCPCT